MMGALDEGKHGLEGWKGGGAFPVGFYSRSEIGPQRGRRVPP